MNIVNYADISIVFLKKNQNVVENQEELKNTLKEYIMNDVNKKIIKKYYIDHHLLMI